jgi:phosphoserine phosphatase
VPDDSIQLVAFDMEGCLTADPTVWEIMHRKLGTWESHGLPYWQRYRAGELEYDQFACMDVAAWRGAPAPLLEQAAREVPLMQGCAELLRALHVEGVRVAIITNGLACVARRFQEAFGVSHLHANEVRVEGGRLTGEVEIRVPYSGKGELLRALAETLGLRRDQIAALGDSDSDIAMFQQARIGIAFCPSMPSVAAAATHLVPHPDLRSVLDILRQR